MVCEKQCPPFRAWFELSSASSTLKVSHDVTTTGIETTLAADPRGTAGLYDLQGRLVERPQSGRLYIKNGKKVIF